MKIIFNDTADLQLLHPVTKEPLSLGKGKPVVAIIYGTHTSAYINVVNEAKRDALNKRLASGDEEKSEAVTLADIEKEQDNQLDFLCACVKGFKNLEIETENGKLDPNDIRGVLSKTHWIKNQIDLAVVKDDLFLQGAKTA